MEIKYIGGFLGRRFHLNKNNRLKNWSLVEEFIRLYEEKNYDGWFWLGEQAGKWLDAAAYAGLTGDDPELLNRVEAVVARLAKSQEDDGYLGITERHRRNPVRGMQLYEWYYVLHGLLACWRLLKNRTALDTARRLGDYIIKTWGTGPGQYPLLGRYPGNGHDGGEGTLILEPVVLLGMYTGEKRFIIWGEETLGMWDTWAERYPESVHTGSYRLMKAAARGEKEIHEIRENIHAHTLHMNLLGIAALYEATGKAEYRRTVLGCVNQIADKYLFLTGGMSAGERYIDHAYYHPRNEIEVCPLHTWVLLLEYALKWTGEPRYAEEMERTLFNSFPAAQVADGSNWSYMTPLNGQAQKPSTPNCCNAAGHRLMGRVADFLYGQKDSLLLIHQYTESSACFTLSPDRQVTLTQKTAYPSDGRVLIEVEPPAAFEFTLALRIPAQANQEVKLSLNGQFQKGVVPGKYYKLTRVWQKGDRVELLIPLAITVQAGPEEAAVKRGPLVYAYFQSWQDNPGKYRWIQGIYPEDVQILLDPQEPAGARAITEEPAPPGCLGPALRLPARLKPRAPVFAGLPGNSRLPKAEYFSARLLPFANQGTCLGPYAVFLAYIQNRPRAR